VTQTSRVDAKRPTLFVVVGLPGAGKTQRAQELAQTFHGLRLTPDEWMIPLFAHNDADGKRNVLEGRFIWLALQALELGVNVILDFGVWSRVERSALRHLARQAGASCELVYLAVDPREQRRRLSSRGNSAGKTTFRISDSDLARYREIFEPPGEDELSSEVIDPPPGGHATWEAWAAAWWPTSLG
jgi:predicted kinase